MSRPQAEARIDAGCLGGRCRRADRRRAGVVRQAGTASAAEGWQRSRVLALFDSEALAETAEVLRPRSRSGLTVAACWPWPRSRIRTGCASRGHNSHRWKSGPISGSYPLGVLRRRSASGDTARSAASLNAGDIRLTRNACAGSLTTRQLVQRVLDYGLQLQASAIGAAKYGAHQVDAVDIPTPPPWSPRSAMPRPIR